MVLAKGFLLPRRNDIRAWGQTFPSLFSQQAAQAASQRGQPTSVPCSLKELVD